jgi:PPK2 family polyphosphate:nucleotide phosphotransferase
VSGGSDAPAGADLRERLRVAPGAALDLRSRDPRETFGHDKDSAKDGLDATAERLHDLQERLWASRGRGVLVVLQGMDTSGKGGAIEHVMGAFNPQGVSVASFKVPTEEERAHDFLWRIHRRTPGRGEIAIFDRSHYEDVLVVRVKSLVPEAVWRPRYEHIRSWERTLADEGTTIVKFFLHISSDEQRERLQARLDDPDKRWKFRLGDLDERRRWDDYLAAYEEALARTSEEHAPWYVVPADRKWFRNLAVSEILVATLDEMGLRFPEPEENLEGVVVT